MFVPLYRKSGKAEAQNQMGQSVTHASIQPTQSPSWEEILLVEFREENSKDEGWLSGKFYSFLCNTVHGRPSSLKSTVKQATKTYNLFCNIATK